MNYIFCWQKVRERKDDKNKNTSKDEHEGLVQRTQRILPIFNYIVSSLWCFHAIAKDTKKLQSVKVVSVSLCCVLGLLFVIIYISALSMFSHTFIKCLLSTFLLFFSILLFCYLYDDAFGFGNLKQVHWKQSITQRPSMNATLKRRQFSKFQLTWKTKLRV